jgi:hypothetical protein
MRVNLLALAVVGVLASGAIVRAAEDAKKSEESSFGALKAPNATEVRKQADAWLKAVGKADAASQAKVNAAWASDRPLLDKVAAVLAIGDADAARLMAEARDGTKPAPTAVPAILKDRKKPAFFRANLALAYGRALTTRKVYEEGLEALTTVRPEEAVDPAALFFHKAVCEYQLMLKDNAEATIDRLLVDISDSPERYRMVGALMHFDMLTWQEKDLGWIARKMDNIQRRLDLKRGGQKTQKQQKEVLVRLDEMIKEIENKQKQQQGKPGDGNEGNCPSGGDGGPDAPGTQPQSTSPQKDTQGGTANGSGQVDQKKVKEIAEVWGKLPEKERAQAIRDLLRTLPAKDRAVIEAYLREIQKRSSK